MSSIKKQNVKSPQGYTIIELSIVLLVGSILTFSVYTYLSGKSDRKLYETTIERMDKIEEKLLEFLSENGRLPCPARPLLAKDTLEYGKEALNDSSLSSPAECIIDDGVKVIDDSNTAIYQGAVPVFSLDLNGENIADGYGNQFSYVVTRSYINSEATNSDCAVFPIASGGGFGTGDSLICFAAERGAVSLHNNQIGLYGVFQPDSESGNEIQGIAYVLISYGRNDGGAFLKNAQYQFQKRDLDSDTPKATYLNLGCNASGECNDEELLNNGQYVLTSAPQNQTIYTNIVRFGARNNLVIECNKNFDGKCSTDWNLDVR